MSTWLKQSCISQNSISYVFPVHVHHQWSSYGRSEGQKKSNAHFDILSLICSITSCPETTQGPTVAFLPLILLHTLHLWAICICLTPWWRVLASAGHLDHQDQSQQEWVPVYPQLYGLQLILRGLRWPDFSHFTIFLSKLPASDIKTTTLCRLLTQLPQLSKGKSLKILSLLLYQFYCMKLPLYIIVVSRCVYTFIIC